MYKATEWRLNELRSKDEILFRMAISHLMDVGFRHLTPENIEETCAEINKEDDSHSFMTNGYKCALVRMAGEMAKLDHIELLVYIQQNVEYAIYDDDGEIMIPYRRMKEIAQSALDYVQQNSDELWNGSEYVDEFTYVAEQEIGATESELRMLGFHVGEEEEDE